MTLDTKREIEILRVSTDGDRDTKLFEQNYAKRTATRIRDAKYIKICPKIRTNGLYEPEKTIFGLISPIFDDFRRFSHEKQPRKEENSVQQGVPPYSAQGPTSRRAWYNPRRRGLHLLSMCAVR